VIEGSLSNCHHHDQRHKISTNNDTTITKVDASDDDFIEIQRNNNNNDRNTICINKDTNCRWIIADIPIITTSRPNLYLAYIIDLVETGTTLDPTLSLVKADIPAESLNGTTCTDVLRLNDLGPNPPQETRIKTFLRNYRIRPASKPLQEKGIKWKCQFKVKQYCNFLLHQQPDGTHPIVL